MTYYTQLLAAGVSPEEAMRSYVQNEVMRITNFERYSREAESPHETHEQEEA